MSETFNLAAYSNSPDHYAKGTQSRLRHTALPVLTRTSRRSFHGFCRFHSVKCHIALLPLVSVWFQVLFHSPQRGSFHFSVALLRSLSVAEEYLALGGGPPRFTPGFTCPVLLGWSIESARAFAYRTFTFYGHGIPSVFC